MPITYLKILTVYKPLFNIKKGVKNIQTAGYNGARASTYWVLKLKDPIIFALCPMLSKTIKKSARKVPRSFSDTFILYQAL